jgi:catechol 2,3-dioxygenase-like lactoylglutathione lyase family enzyme
VANTPSQQASVGTVILATSDMARAVAFYRDVFGFQVVFADGDRWTAIDGNGARLALAGQREHLGEPIVLAIKVADLEAAVAAAIAAGAEQQSQPRTSQHETSVEVLTPDGQLLSLYTPVGATTSKTGQ